MAQDNEGAGGNLPPFRAIEQEGTEALLRAVDELVRQAVQNRGKADLERLQRLGPAGVKLFVERLAANAVPTERAGVAEKATLVRPSPSTTRMLSTSAIQAKNASENSQPASLVNARRPPRKVPRQVTAPDGGSKAGSTDRRPTTHSPVSTGWADQRCLRPSFNQKGFRQALVVTIGLTLMVVALLYVTGK